MAWVEVMPCGLKKEFSTNIENYYLNKGNKWAQNVKESAMLEEPDGVCNRMVVQIGTLPMKILEANHSLTL